MKIGYTAWYLMLANANQSLSLLPYMSHCICMAGSDKNYVLRSKNFPIIYGENKSTISMLYSTTLLCDTNDAYVVFHNFARSLYKVDLVVCLTPDVGTLT